jgi:GAF domain-containing protein
MSPTSDSTFAELQQTIDDLRQQLAERTAERDQALAREAATGEVLGVINSSPGDLAPVFDAMLENAMRLCEADFAGLWTYDGEHVHPAALHRVPPAYAEFMTRRDQPVSPNNTRARLIRGEPFVHIPDAAALPDNPLRRAFVELGGGRAQLAVPLRKDGALIGILTVYRKEPRPFSDKQIALLQNFAAQAVVAMENARLITETREALEQQTATAEVLGVINSSPGELAPVFDAMLEKAMRLCEAAFGILLSYDGEHFRHAALRSVPASYGEFMRQNPPDYGPETGPGRILAGERLVHVPDMRDTDLYRRADPNRRALVDFAGARTVVLVPLLKDDAVRGVITAFRQEVRPFTDKQIALLQNFAAQAVIAMENARLFTETREALEQQTATAEVLGVINASPGDLTPVFNAMLEKALRLCEAACGELWTYDGECARVSASRGAPSAFADFLAKAELRPGPETAPGRALQGEPVVHIADVAQEKSANPVRRAVVDLGGARTVLAVPLHKEGTPVGTFTIYRTEVRPFSEKQIALLQNFAAQAVIAMENARLITETREALEQQTATAEVLQVINSSPGDPAPVFEAMLDKAVRLCGAAFGLMMVTEGEEAPTVASRGVPSAFAEFRRTNPVSMAKGPIFSRLLAGEAFVHTLDLKDDDAYRRGDPLRCATVDLGGGRTSLMVALRRDREVLGAIHLYRQELRPFSDKQIALLQNFAAQAVIAMENARLLGELRQRTEEVAELNRGLAARVAEQVEELGRVGRLKRFLAPQLAELIVSQGDEKILESHRREIVVVFCDLRGYTAFTETAEPEEVLDFLREYHGALGPLVSQFEGTLDQFSGDGIMVFFNDPLPIPNPAERAVNMAVAMREAAGSLIAAWRERGRDLGFGCGVAQGYATLGQIGFSERSGYTAIGTVCNVAARLCAEAKDGQILLSQRVNVALRGSVVTEQVGALALKGLTQPVIAFNVPLAASQPALRVIEGGPQNV